jgi:universal stress protein E
VPLAALMAPMAMQAIAAVPSKKEEAAYERRVRQGFAALARRARIPPARRHLRAGDVPTQLSDVVRRTGAQLVVMGSLSRSGLKRLLIGNTFERVLDRLECDVLVVKPARFASRVPKRRSGVRWTALPLALP